MPDLESAADEELVRAFVHQGDRDALEVLLRRHETRVYGLAYRLLGNRADALDAAQEIFITLFRKARSFRGESAFTTWLHRLTVNTCHDFGRKRARTPEPAEELEGSSPDAISAADDRMQIEEALAALAEEQRTAVVLRDFRGFSYQEIAQATGVPVGTVKSRIARARLALATILETGEAREAGSTAPSRKTWTSAEPAPETTRLKDKE